MGEAPLSQYPHMKVIRLILDQSPPTLPSQGWSDEFKAFVNSCLHKDPRERPSIEDLLVQQQPFLSKARDAAFLQQYFLSSLPPLQQRLAPELAAHGQSFLTLLNSTDKKPKKKSRHFDFGSGGDRRTANNKAGA